MKLEFEQRPKESDKAFAAFAMYLGMGAERSLSAVAAKLGKSKVLMERWSRRHDWSARVAAHGAYLAAIEQEAMKGVAHEKAFDLSLARSAVRIAEWERSKKLLGLADEMLARWYRNKSKCPTLEGIARVLELATKLARMSVGMPTEVKETNETFTAKLDVNWEVALKKVYPDAPAKVTDAVVDVETITQGEPQA